MAAPVPDPSPAPAQRIQTSRHIDALDAGRISEAWIQDLIDRYPAIPDREMEYKNFANTDGTVTVFWHKRHPVGIAVALRDAMNWTHLTLIESPKPGPGIGPAAHEDPVPCD